MAQTQLAGTIANGTNHSRRDRPLARNHRAAASHRRLAIATPAISSVATGSGSGKGECQGSQTPAAMMTSPTAARHMVRAPAEDLGAEPARAVAGESVIAVGHAAGNACRHPRTRVHVGPQGAPGAAYRVIPRISSEPAERWPP